MKVTVKSVLLVGIVPVVVPVVVEVEPGEAPFTINGLPDVHLRETRIRCRAALQQIGVDLAKLKVTVTLDMPAGASGSIDLAVAFGVIVTCGRFLPLDLESTAFVGELSLTGAVRPIRGIAPIVAFANTIGIARLVLPLSNRMEAAHASHHAGGRTKIVAIETLGESIDHERELPTLPTHRAAPSPSAIDMSDVRGLDGAKRALEIAAVGGHSVLWIAVRGSGATMLSRRLCGILPAMTEAEQVEATAIHSTSGLLRAEQGWIDERPFRAPHHTCSAAGLLGGGNLPRPGELSLATHGIILLDELAEFRPTVLDEVAISLKAGEHRFVTFEKGVTAKTRCVLPTRPTLVATVAPCPCGYSGVRSTKRCQCSPERIEAHFARLRASKLWNHFDLHVRLPAPDATPPEELSAIPRGETSATVRARVIVAQLRHTPTLGRDLAERNVLRKMAREFARSSSPVEVDRVVALARTVAKVDGCDTVKPEHLTEAKGLRMIAREEVGS
jgi:magnesium chelatase family protein